MDYPQDAVDSYIELFEKNPNPEAVAGRWFFGCLAIAAGAVVAAAALIAYFTS